MSKDYYHILGVPRDSSKEEIKRAYFILANQYHPDKPNGSEKRFKEINEAYRILSYADSRAKHDEESKNNKSDDGQRESNDTSKSEEQPKEKESTQSIDIESLKKSVRRTGNLTYHVGWWTIALSAIIFIWSLLDKNFSDSGLPEPDFLSFLLMVVVSVTMIILGRRIKQLLDVKIKNYLQILIGLSVVLFILIVWTGGKVGILFFILLAYLISSLVKINKLMKVKEFAFSLTKVKYSSLWDFTGDIGPEKPAEQKEKRAEKQSGIIYGVIGIAVILSIWGLVNILTSSAKPDTTTNDAPVVTNTAPVASVKTGLEFCQDSSGSHATYDSASNSCGCEAGYINNGKSCITYTQSCRESYPNTKWDGTKNDKGKFACVCATGYGGHKSSTGCVSNNQICSMDVPNSMWNGEYADNGNVICVSK